MGTPLPVKEIVTVRPASFTQKSYLETENDVDAFVATVKKALGQEIKNGKRVRIE